MMTVLIAWVAKMPAALKVATGLGLVTLGLVVVHRIQMGNLRDELVSVREQLVTQQQVTAIQAKQIQDVTANRDQLRADVQAQNRAVQALQTAAVQADQRADRSAAQVLAAGRREAALLRETVPIVATGQEGMNAWIAASFAPR